MSGDVGKMGRGEGDTLIFSASRVSCEDGQKTESDGSSDDWIDIDTKAAEDRVCEE